MHSYLRDECVSSASIYNRRVIDSLYAKSVSSKVFDPYTGIVHVRRSNLWRHQNERKVPDKLDQVFSYVVCPYSDNYFNPRTNYRASSLNNQSTLTAYIPVNAAASVLAATAAANANSATPTENSSIIDSHNETYNRTTTQADEISKQAQQTSQISHELYIPGGISYEVAGLNYHLKNHHSTMIQHSTLAAKRVSRGVMNAKHGGAVKRVRTSTGFNGRMLGCNTEISCLTANSIIHVPNTRDNDAEPLNHQYIGGAPQQARNVTVTDSLSPPPQPSKVVRKCDYCTGDEFGTEQLIICSQCQRAGHPSCMKFTPSMAAAIRKYDWQCLDCKTCSTCGKAGCDDQLLFCDRCDRGHHTYCLEPKLTHAPKDEWMCAQCQALPSTTTD
ncbi:hypothetical protein ACOME3_009150 [Neoechinorhynchus agilis]